MDIATFIRSEHGRSISQNKLYRRLRRFVEKETAHQSSPVSRDFYGEGFRVKEDERGQFRYEVYRPERFCAWALEKAGWRQPSQEEMRLLLKGARLLRDLAEGEDEKWFLGSRLTASEINIITGERRRLLDALDEIVEKCMPEG